MVSRCAHARLFPYTVLDLGVFRATPYFPFGAIRWITDADWNLRIVMRVIKIHFGQRDGGRRILLPIYRNVTSPAKAENAAVCRTFASVVSLLRHDQERKPGETE